MLPALSLILFLYSAKSFAGVLDEIGATLLFSVTTHLNGSGVRAAQVETEFTAGGTDWEVSPSYLGRSPGYITYYKSFLGTTNYPNSIGTESGHADAVANLGFGLTSGVATNLLHLDNYEANYFVQFLSGINGDPVVNQSYTYGTQTPADQETTDSSFDDFSQRYNTLFVSGANNGGTVAAPATSYNGIGVGAYQGSTASGPTLDNGRAKPDLCAPASETSYSTPLVTGSAALLLQAAVRGDGGSDTNSSANLKTIKALLLNGTVKPGSWSAPSPSPLDPVYGAGVLNVFNSYKQLTGGKHPYSSTRSVGTGASHLPLGTGTVISNLSGWDNNTITSSTTKDAINEYDFTVTNSISNATFTGTLTLVWNRQLNQTNINHLNLYLYDLSNSQLVGASTSAVDNVQMIYLRNLPAGKYALEVLKAGGNTVSTSETYALAYEFFSTSLNLNRSGNSLVLSWPIYPAGFTLQTSTSLSRTNASWSAVTNGVTLSNNMNRTVVSIAGGNQFFRLQR